jgi:membrane associated rhomboid family serine protease
VERDEPPRPLGPLNRLPLLRHAIPAIVLIMVFFIASALAHKYDFVDMLSVSGRDVFTRYEFWRCATALAIHADLPHLLSNGLLFILFGWMLHSYFGLAMFPGLSALAGMVTNIIVACIYDPEVSVIGASGMTHAMVAIWIVLYLKFDTDRTIPVRLFRALGFVLVMLAPSAIEAHVSYLSHAVGFAVGTAMSLALLPFARVRMTDPYPAQEARGE